MAKLEFNTVEGLTKIQESINNVFDRYRNEIELVEKLKSIRNESFGVYKVLFESQLANLYETSEGQKLIKKYIKLLSENHDINRLFQIYKNIENNQSFNSTVQAYLIKESCSSIDKDNLLRGTKNMSKIWEQTAFITKVSPDTIDKIIEDNKQLNEAINRIINLKNGIKYINENTNAITNLATIIESYNHPTNDNEYTTEKPKKVLYSELSTLIESDEHTTWEKRVLSDISLCEISGKNRSELFETYKTDCINRINVLCETADTDKQQRLNGIKQHLELKQLNENTLVDDLFTLSELFETLNSPDA